MTRILKTPLFVALTIFFCIGCGADDDIVEPAPPEITNVTTEENVEANFTSITISGSIAYDNPDDLMAYGVVWGTNENPDITDNVIDESTGGANAVIKGDQMKATQSGNIDFTAEVTGLNPNETYFFRIFATTAQETVYGAQMSYSTLSLADTTWDIHYQYDVQAGNTWHADVTFHADGTAFYTEPDNPGVYDTWGTWSLSGDQLSYDMLGSGSGGDYYLTGTVGNGVMDGTYTWGADNRPWEAVLYP